MAKKIVWVVVSCLMVLSLVMASCGPAEEAEVEVGEEEVEVGEAEVTEEEEEVEEVVQPSDVPRYGGTLRLVQIADSSAWDDVVTRSFVQPITMIQTNDSM